MQFSVVVPTFNRRPLLREALDSVWSQTLTDYEVIVVDDGSTDGTREDLTAAGDRLTAIFQTNQGPGAARNAGIARARGHYIAFLDSDDRWFPWTLATLAHLVRAHGSPALITGCVIDFGDPADLARVSDQPPAGTQYADFLASARSPLLVGSGSIAIRADVAQSSGGFTTRRINGEDHDLILRFGNVAGFVAVTAPVTVAWRRHDGSATRSLPMSIEGARYLIEQERAGAYPGGADRATLRRLFIGRHVRPISIWCLKAGAISQAFRLYFATFAWHLRLNRWAYLLGFPALATWSLIRRPRREQPT